MKVPPDLQKLWYAKLAASGFEDIEDTSNPHSPLKAWHSWRFNQPGVKQESAALYYQRASELLNFYHFLNLTHRQIWSLHAEGWSKRQIEKAIQHMKPRYKREQIGNIIAKIAKEIR